MDWTGLADVPPLGRSTSSITTESAPPSPVAP